MTSFVRRIAAAALVAFGFSLPAAASTSGVDYTDLWYDPNESAWGINLIQQGGTIFATVFVYGPDRTPHWFVASEMSGGGNGYSGVLYQTSGPAFNGPWTGGVTAPPVGSISVNFSSPNTGTLSYTASGSSVTKSIQRQTFRGNDLGGRYFGAFVGQASGCAASGNVAASGEFDIAHSNPAAGGTVRIELRSIWPNTGTCIYNGNFAPNGKSGTITGTYTCTLGPTNGTFTISEVTATRTGFSGVYSARDNLACNYAGYFGGSRDVR